MSDLKTRLTTLDFSTEKQSIDTIKGKADEIDAARDRAHARISVLNQTLAELAEGKYDGQDAADALMSGESVASAAPQKEAMEQEKKAIVAGLNNLAERERNLDHQRRDVIETVRQASSVACQPEYERLKAHAEVTVQNLYQIWADLTALANAGHHGGAGNFARNLHQALLDLRANADFRYFEIKPSADLKASLEHNPARQIIHSGVPATLTI